MPPRASALHDLSTITARYRRRRRNSSNPQPEDRQPTPTPQGKSSRPKKRPAPLSLDPTEIIPGWEIYRDPSTESLVPEDRPHQPSPESSIEPGPTIRRSTRDSRPTATTSAAAATWINDGNMAGRLNFLRLVSSTIIDPGNDESVRMADRVVQTFNDVLAEEKAREEADRAASVDGGAGANVRTAAANQAEFIQRLQERYEMLTLLEEGGGSQVQPEPEHQHQSQPQRQGYGDEHGYGHQHGHGRPQPPTLTSDYINPAHEAPAAPEFHPYPHSTYNPPTGIVPETPRPHTTPTHYNYTSPTTLPHYIPSPPRFTAPIPRQQITGPSSDILSRSLATQTHAPVGLGVGPGPSFAERVRTRPRKRARSIEPDPGFGTDDDDDDGEEDELLTLDEMVRRDAEMEYEDLDWSGGGDESSGFAATAAATAGGGHDGAAGGVGHDIADAEMSMQMRTQDPFVVYAYTHTYQQQQQQRQQNQQ